MHPLIACAECEAFANFVSVLDLAVQTGLLVVAGIAAWFAYHAYIAQSGQLRILQDGQRDANEEKAASAMRARRASGPFFRNAAGVCASDLILSDGSTVSTSEYFPNADFVSTVAGKTKRLASGGSFYLLVKNVRPNRAMVDSSLKFISPPPGLSETLHIYKVASAKNGDLPQGDYYVIFYYAVAGAYHASPCVRFTIDFETYDGSIDRHTYATVIGSSIIEREDPPRKW